MTNIADRRFVQDLQAAATAAGVAVESVDANRIQAIAGSQSTQGVVAEVREVVLLRVDEMIQRAQSRTQSPLFLVVDQIQDPRNLGSLLRSGEAAGVQGVILTERHSSPLSGVVAKSSAGAMFHVPIAVAGNLADTLKKLAHSGIWSFGLAHNADTSIYDIDMTVPAAIVVGGEEKGMRTLTAQRVDLTASIPMQGRIASLNASVAGAIALFEANRQRTAVANSPV